MLGEDIRVFSGFHLLFVENEGMAYGITLGSKLFLTLFRIIAMGLLSWGVARLIRSGKFSTWFLIVLALITAGGIGNIIDSLFYGLMFSASQKDIIAEIFPKDGGYAPLLWVDVLLQPGDHCRDFPKRRRLCTSLLWACCRHVFLPTDRLYTTLVDPQMGWAAVYILRSHLQFCRCVHQRWRCGSYSILPHTAISRP